MLLWRSQYPNITLLQDGYKPQCSGLGVIDCAGECAGTEEEFKKFMEVMEDKDFDKKFPELAKVKKSQEKQENKVAEIPLDGGESVSGAEGGGGEEREDVRTKFMKGLLKCTNFSQETMALLSLMNPNGEGGESYPHLLFISFIFVCRSWQPRYFGSKQQGLC